MITFLSRSGRFSARVVGQSRGNVVLRKTQYRVSDDLEASAVIARNFIVGKIFNARELISSACNEIIHLGLMLSDSI